MPLSCLKNLLSTLLRRELSTSAVHMHVFRVEKHQDQENLLADSPLSTTSFACLLQSHLLCILCSELRTMLEKESVCCSKHLTNAACGRLCAPDRRMGELKPLLISYTKHWFPASPEDSASIQHRLPLLLVCPHHTSNCCFPSWSLCKVDLPSKGLKMSKDSLRGMVGKFSLRQGYKVSR